MFEFEANMLVTIVHMVRELLSLVEIVTGAVHLPVCHLAQMMCAPAMLAG
jgi:hypothetical protein